MKSILKRSAGAVLAILAAAACNNARVSGTIEGAGNMQIEVNLLDINKFQAVDTISTDAAGNFSCKLEVSKGNPEFYYFCRNGRRLASVLVDAGDRIELKADTLGNFSLSGSEEAELYSSVESDYRAFTADMNELVAKLESDSENYAANSKALTARYVQYYRDRIRFVMEHSHSIAVVPVFYQKAGQLPLFSQQTDALRFREVSDSLLLSYPESRYVKALRSEAEARMNALDLSAKLSTAEAVNFPDIVLPDLKGEKRKLSETDAKVVLLHFWSNSVPEQRQMNIELLKPLYQMYYGRGLDIYQVCLDADKGGWAATVRSQNLPWVNVCDIDASASRYATLYRVDRVPMTFIISNGELLDVKIEDVSQLLNLLDKLLK